MVVFVDDHAPWTVFLEHRPTTVNSIPTYGRKRCFLSKGNIDGSYLILVKTIFYNMSNNYQTSVVAVVCEAGYTTN